MPTQILVYPMVEATRPGLLTSVASPLTYAGWDCGRGSASSSVTQLAWRSSSSSSSAPCQILVRLDVNTSHELVGRGAAQHGRTCLCTWFAGKLSCSLSPTSLMHVWLDEVMRLIKGDMMARILAAGDLGYTAIGGNSMVCIWSEGAFTSVSSRPTGYILVCTDCFAPAVAVLQPPRDCWGLSCLCQVPMRSW